MDPIVSFNIPVQDMKRAGEFYRRVFDWAIAPMQGSGGDYHRAGTVDVDEDGVPLMPGTINGGFFKKGTHGIDGPFPEIEVGSIEETVAKVQENGGTVVLEKRPMLDFTFFAIVQDPEGNWIGLKEYRRS